MSSKIEFKDLWQKKVSEPPKLAEVVSLANKAKKHLLLRTLFITTILCLTAAFIISIWVYHQPQYLSTKIGICLTILAITTVVLAQVSMLPYLKKEKDNASVRDYLNQLQIIRKKEMFLQTTLMNFYFITLSLGVFMYMYEYVPKTFLSISLTYGITLAWFAFNWFYLRPKSTKKYQEKTNSLISKFEEIQKQLKEE